MGMVSMSLSAATSQYLHRVYIVRIVNVLIQHLQNVFVLRCKILPYLKIEILKSWSHSAKKGC